MMNLWEYIRYYIEEQHFRETDDKFKCTKVVYKDYPCNCIPIIGMNYALGFASLCLKNTHVLYSLIWDEAKGTYMPQTCSDTGIRTGYNLLAENEEDKDTYFYDFLCRDYPLEYAQIKIRKKNEEETKEEKNTYINSKEQLIFDINEIRFGYDKKYWFFLYIVYAKRCCSEMEKYSLLLFRLHALFFPFKIVEIIKRSCRDIKSKGEKEKEAYVTYHITFWECFQKLAGMNDISLKIRSELVTSIDDYCDVYIQGIEEDMEKSRSDRGRIEAKDLYPMLREQIKFLRGTEFTWCECVYELKMLTEKNELQERTDQLLCVMCEKCEINCNCNKKWKHYAGEEGRTS